MKFEKFLRTLFVTEHLHWLLWKLNICLSYRFITYCNRNYRLVQMQTLQKRSERLQKRNDIERWIQCLLLRLKSWSAREAFMGNCPTVSHTCILYLPRRWVSFLVPGVADRNHHAGWIEGFIFLFMGLITWNGELRWVQDFLLLPQGFESCPYCERGGVI